MDPIARNLAVVDAHIRDEARDPAAVMDLYTDDIVLVQSDRGKLVAIGALARLAQIWAVDIPAA